MPKKAKDAGADLGFTDSNLSHKSMVNMTHHSNLYWFL
jgi:hypothetical protein